MLSCARISAARGAACSRRTTTAVTSRLLRGTRRHFAALPTTGGDHCRDETGQFDYDLIIIGSGPAGYAAAVRAWDLGKRVCVIEKTWLGGAGVWDGALSSKTEWQLSRRARGFSDFLRSSNSGLNFEGNYGKVPYRRCGAHAIIP